MPPRAWVLNLDAELELAGRVPSAASRRRTDALRRALATTLPPEDVVLDVHPDAAARGLLGAAWCPTRGALARLARVGARLPDAPRVDVLRRVNDRAFAFELAHLPEARRCRTLAEAEAALARPGRWLARRGLGFAGRGVRRIDGGALDAADRAFLEASFALGSLVVEPRLAVTLDVALHAHTDGRRGAITVQTIDRHGQWAASRRAEPGEVAEPERAALEAMVERVASALVGAGYFGPFGIDAFRWSGPEGAARFHPLSEINARYSMGWPVGMGGWSADPLGEP